MQCNANYIRAELGLLLKAGDGGGKDSRASIDGASLASFSLSRVLSVSNLDIETETCHNVKNYATHMPAMSGSD